MELVNTKVTNTLRYLVISDIHLGHNNNQADNIIKNLDTFFKGYKDDIFKLDILFIAGDIFDSSLKLSNPESSVIIHWMSSLLIYCDKFNIMLRILEGTPSHDWKQAINFEPIKNKLTPNLNYKYIKVLHIENIPEFNLNVLYVPDEWRTSTDQTLKEVDQLLKENNLNQVDIAIMHGNFKYQLKQAPDSIPKHDEASYLSRVKHFINIGHIHKFSMYERIVAQGSFDRLVHNEEEPKGCTLMTISDTEEDSFVFLENKDAMKFVTINGSNLTLENIYDKLDRLVSKLPKGSYIRFKLKSDSKIINIIKDLRLKYFEYVISKPKIIDEIEEETKLISDDILDDNFTPIQVTKDNIRFLLNNELEIMNDIEDLHPHITNIVIDELINEEK